MHYAVCMYIFRICAAKMIDLSQWRASIGFFNSRVRCIGREYCSSTDSVSLHTVVSVVLDVTVLQMLMYAITVLLLLLCGDIETHPGPVCYTVCPNCNIQVHIRKKICECGYTIRKKCGRQTGTNRSAGFNVSSGRPTANRSIKLNVPTGRPVSNVDIELDVPRGHPTSDVQVELDVPRGHPTSDVQVELDVPRGHPTSDVNVELDVSIGRPFGTTYNSGFDVSTGRPISTYTCCTNTTTPVSCIVEDADSTTAFIEDNLVLLTQYIEQYDLPSAWDTDKTNLSLPDNLLVRAKRRIGQQVRFDAKPLGIAMCYCCGSILWSRVDNCHTHLVKLDLEDKIIPAVAYQHTMVASGRGYLNYRHKSGKLYSCSACNSYKNPTEYSSIFHVGKTDKPSTVDWDMVYPVQITSLKTELEKCQVALCGIFSTTIKDVKKHQWRHIQGEVNALHKLDRHYYGMFGFLLMNEKITESLTKYSDACERIRVALHWLKKNNHLYESFLAHFETMY